VVLNAAAKVLFHCGRLSEALALYRDAEALARPVLQGPGMAVS